MARRYYVPIDQASVAMGTAQDLVQISGAAGKMLRIIGCDLYPTGGTSLATSATFSVRGRFLPATVTVTGGTGVTPQKIDPGDAAASFTATTLNTTKTTTSGTAQVVMEGGGHVYSGFSFMFPTPPVVGPSEAFVFELLAGLTQSITCGGGVLVEEIGG